MKPTHTDILLGTLKEKFIKATLSQHKGERREYKGEIPSECIDKSYIDKYKCRLKGNEVYVIYHEFVINETIYLLLQQCIYARDLIERNSGYKIYNRKKTISV